MILQCDVPEGFYCVIQPVSEWWEFLLLFGGIILIFAVLIGIGLWLTR